MTDKNWNILALAIRELVEIPTSGTVTPNDFRPFVERLSKSNTNHGLNAVRLLHLASPAKNPSTSRILNARQLQEIVQAAYLAQWGADDIHQRIVAPVSAISGKNYVLLEGGKNKYFYEIRTSEKLEHTRRPDLKDRKVVAKSKTLEELNPDPLTALVEAINSVKPPHNFRKFNYLSNQIMKITLPTASNSEIADLMCLTLGGENDNFYNSAVGYAARKKLKTDNPPYPDPDRVKNMRDEFSPDPISIFYVLALFEVATNQLSPDMEKRFYKEKHIVKTLDDGVKDKLRDKFVRLWGEIA